MKDKEGAACSGAQSFKRYSARFGHVWTWVRRGQQDEAKGRVHHLAGMGCAIEQHRGCSGDRQAAKSDGGGRTPSARRAVYGTGV